MIDYHIHTTLCNHAVGLMEEYVKQALELGLKEICFLDHLTLNQAGQSLSMGINEVSLYYQSVCRLREKYKNRLAVKVGLEIDYNPDYIDRIEDIIQTFGFDLIGSSVHFINNENVVSRRVADRLADHPIDGLYTDYYQALSEMLDFNYYDVICHPDVIKKFGRAPTRSFETEIDHILSKIRTKGLTVEVNTSGFNHPVNDLYPDLDILKKCQAFKIPITLGSDAHKPKDVGRHFVKTLTKLKSIGYHQLSAFSQRKPYTLSFE